MRFLVVATAFLAAASNAVQALDDAVPKQATCFTIKDLQSVDSVPTRLNTVTVKVTKTITTEITTSTKTITTTDTVVFTASTHTDTVSNIRTVTATITAHSTPPASTKTTTTTSTVTVSSTSTTTVATTSGFRPVESTLTKTVERKKRDTYWDRVHARDRLSGLAKRAQSSPKYIQSVDCKIYTTTTTSTLYATRSVVATVTAADSTVTKTTTKTVTKSQTTSPVITKTITSTKQAITTSTDTSPASVTTKTVTKTTTTTDIIPGPTIYAACTGSNIHSSKAISEEYYDIEIDSGSYQANTYRFSTAYDCCVACITQFNCTAGIFDPNNGNLCSFNFNDACGPQASAQETADYFNDTPVSSVFNGLCGELTTRNYAGD